MVTVVDIKRILGLAPRIPKDVFPQFAAYLGLKGAVGTIHITDEDSDAGIVDINVTLKVPDTNQKVHIRGVINIKVYEEGSPDA